MRPSISFLALLWVVYTTSCVTRTNDYEHSTVEFLNRFQANLLANDSIILSTFRVSKTSETLIKAIRIMQNSNSNKDSITCALNFDAATIDLSSENIRIKVDAMLKSINRKIKVESQATISIELDWNRQAPSIIHFDADELYYEYRSLQYEIESQKNSAIENAKRKNLFDLARNLQAEGYDSVVWVTSYKDSTYFYVILGEWNNYFLNNDLLKPENCSMGLVSETGRVVVAPEYDLVGTIGFERPDIIEVKKDGKVGHVSINGQVLLPPIYEVVVPYFDSDTIYALVKKDSTLGWISKDYKFYPGVLKNNIEKYWKEFRYLQKPISIQEDRITMIRILSEEAFRFGIVVPPNNFATLGIFDEIVSHVMLSDGWGNVEKIATEGSSFKQITDNLVSLVVTIAQSYVGGRESFYKTTNNLSFHDNLGRRLGSYQVETNFKNIHLIDSTLLELSYDVTFDGYKRDERGLVKDVSGLEVNPPQSKYFRIDNGKVNEIESNRRFQITQFIKLDSSHLSGEFRYYDSLENMRSIKKFVHAEKIVEMRDEILASYGFIFPPGSSADRFAKKKWYTPSYSNLADTRKKMTEIDLYNLEFFERVLKSYNSGAI